jgi:bacterioferritin (cytochrome b1)
VIILDQSGKPNIGVARLGKTILTKNGYLIMEKTIEELLSEESQIVEGSDITVSEEVIDPEITSSQEVESYTSDTVIELLKKSLNIHWQQTTSLSAQAVHLERWGYKKLAAIIKVDAEEEHNHSVINIERLEFFDADYQPLIVAPPAWARHDMLAMIKYNLASVKEAAIAERATIVAARIVGDEMTANIMIPLLQGSENGIKLYEGYLKLIEQMGIDNFLTLQA